jgi:hypothetical protein
VVVGLDKVVTLTWRLDSVNNNRRCGLLPGVNSIDEADLAEEDRALRSDDSAGR